MSRRDAGAGALIRCACLLIGDDPRAIALAAVLILAAGLLQRGGHRTRCRKIYFHGKGAFRYGAEERPEDHGTHVGP